MLLGAALSPTDATLGVSVMSDPRVPARIRRVLNVESGLNDGIATPIVLVAIAGVAADVGVEGPRRAVVALLVGLLVGVVTGAAGGVLTRRARRRDWLSEELAGPAVLALALAAYAGALLVDSNGFVAAFVGGLVVGSTAGRGGEKEVYFVEQTGDLASMISWLIFWALAVPAIGEWIADRVAGGRLRGAQPHRRPDPARCAVASRHRLGPSQPGVHRLVRPVRVGVGHLRAARPRGPARRSPGGGGHYRADRAAQRRRPRPERKAIRRTVHHASRAAGIELGSRLDPCAVRSRC
jgi:Sodium/hydrogen exchanger family